MPSKLSAPKNAAEDPLGANAAVAAILEDQAATAPDIGFPPDEYVTLPGGLRKGSDVIRHAIVRELTGADEEALAKSSQAANPFHFVNTLLERGTVRIGDEDEKETKKFLRELLIGDRDALILGIRRATYGNEIELKDWICPACGDMSDLAVTLHDIPTNEIEIPEDTFEVPLRKGGKAVVRLAIGEDQLTVYENLKLSQPERDTMLLSRCVLSISGKDGGSRAMAGFSSLARDLSIPDRKAILTQLVDRQPGPRFSEIKHTHGACGNEVALLIGVGDLFRDI